MRKLQSFIGLILLISVSAVCQAADSEDLARENAELRQKIEQIEKELLGLKTTVMQQSNDPAEPSAWRPIATIWPGKTPNCGGNSIKSTWNCKV